MARTLETEEESRIKELERLVREGDETDKMIAEVQLDEERRRVARDAAYAIQEEEETETPLVPRIKSKTVLPKATKQAIENERAGLGKELGRDVSKAVKELEPAGLPEKPTPMEEMFSAKDLQKLKRHDEDELAKYNAKQDVKLKKALYEVAGKGAADYSDARERFRKNQLEKHPRATMGQRLQEGLTLGLFSPATKANVESAEAVGAALAEFDARTKLNNATSSAKASRVGAALGEGGTQAVVSVMEGMNSNANLKYLNEVRAKSGSFYHGLLDVKKDATPKEEEAALNRMLYLARQGNPTALLQTRAVEQRYQALDATLLTKGTRDHAAAQKRLTETLAETAKAQSEFSFSEGGKAVNSDGVFDSSLLSEGVLEMMYDKRGSTNSAEWLTNFGLQVMSGANKTVKGHNDALITQIQGNKPEAIRIEEATERFTGVPSANPVSGQSDEELGRSTNPQVLDRQRKDNDTLRAYVKETGKLPAHIGVATNRKNFLLKQQRNLLEEYEGKDTSVLRKLGLKVALRKVKQGLIVADNDLTTAYQRIASDTEKLGATKDRDAELEKQDLGEGLKRIATLKASFPQSVLEMENRGPKEEGIGKGGSMWDYIFLEKNAKGDGYSDVRDVFRPYLVPLNVGLGGKPLGKGEGGNTIIVNSWATRVSSGMERPEGAEKFIRSIDAFFDKDTGKLDKAELKAAPDHIQAQYEAYHSAKNEWERFYSGSADKPADTTAPAATATPPAQPAALTPAQPAAAPTPLHRGHPEYDLSLETSEAEDEAYLNYQKVIQRVEALTLAEGREPSLPEIRAIEEATAAKDVEVMRTMVSKRPTNPTTSQPWKAGDRMIYRGRKYVFNGLKWNLE